MPLTGPSASLGGGPACPVWPVREYLGPRKVVICGYFATTIVRGTRRTKKVFPGRKSDFRTGFWPDCYRENTEIGHPAGRRPAGGPMLVFSW